MLIMIPLNPGGCTVLYYPDGCSEPHPTSWEDPILLLAQSRLVMSDGEMKYLPILIRYQKDCPKQAK
jgi:hypothetical protein